MILLGAAFLLLLSPSLTSDLLIKPGEAEKITVNGHCYVTLYLNGYIELSRSGSPLTRQNVFMNRKKLTHRGGGVYSEAIISSAYAPAIGNAITIRLKAGTGRIFTPGKNRLQNEVVLGKYTLRSYVQWKYPSPGGTISLKVKARPGSNRTIKFTWDHFGDPFRARVKIRNMTANREIFNRPVAAGAEEVRVPASLFRKGDRYQFNIGSDNAMGKFKLTDYVTKRSKIEFYYNDIIYVNAR